ncbi:MAG: hypothetical protein HC833_19380 [Leptolyngbyaceae cyanobacterium RM1_406_9]|nr:hypothetical protein [Leptolyngbyaceae cyanobacterium RM1_406_9]
MAELRYGSRQRGRGDRALEACLNEHDRDYIRLVGIDSNARQRVLETIIQRPDSRN